MLIDMANIIIFIWKKLQTVELMEDGFKKRKVITINNKYIAREDLHPNSTFMPFRVGQYE